MQGTTEGYIYEQIQLGNHEGNQMTWVQCRVRSFVKIDANCDQVLAGYA